MPTDSVRVVLQPDCLGVDLDGRRYDKHDGHITVNGPRAEELRRTADTLPGQMWHFGGTGVEELRCQGCGRRKLALFGPACAWCGGECC